MQPLKPSNRRTEKVPYSGERIPNTFDYRRVKEYDVLTKLVGLPISRG
jgi:hypothetical protein